MKIIIRALLLFCLLLTNTTFTQSRKKTTIEWNGKKIEVAKNEISIKVKKGVDVSLFSNEIQLLGLKIIKKPDDMGVARIQIQDTTNMLNTIELLKKMNFIESASPNVVTHIFLSANDTYNYMQWALPKINASAAWDISTGNSNVIVGVPDTGIPIVNNSLSHPDLLNSNRILLGEDETGDGTGLKDKNGHGTHVAGILSAESNNSTGITGMSWNSRLFIVQVFDSSGNGFASDFYDGVVNAIANGAKVINYSGGGYSPSTDFENGIIYARNQNVLLIASAGNYDPVDNPNKTVGWPAAYSSTYDNVIAVSSTTSSDVLATSSSRGPEVVVAAPGDGIYSTLPNYANRTGYQNYASLSGTSMAAPYVSGLAALILSQNSSLTPVDVRKIIESTADDLGASGFDNLYGYGRINAYKALKYIYVPQAFSTIQEGISKATSNQIVSVAPGTYNESISSWNSKNNLTVDGQNLSTTTINGSISITNSNNVVIRNLKVQSGSLSFTNCNSFNVNPVNYFQNSNPIILTNSYGTYYGINNNNSSGGIYCYNGDITAVDETDITNQGIGVYLYNTSLGYLNYVLFCGNTWDIYTDATSAGYGDNSQYSGDPSSTTYGNVSYSNYSTCGFLKRSSMEDNFIKDPKAYEEFLKAISSYNTVKTKVGKESKECITIDHSKYASEYSAAQEELKKYTATKPTSIYAKTTLSATVRIFKMLSDYEGMKTYLETVACNKDLSSLNGLARRYMLDYYTNKGEYNQAINLADGILKENVTDADLTGDVLYSKGLIYQYSLDNKEEAKKIYVTITDNYAEKPVAFIAKQQLKGLGLIIEEKIETAKIVGKEKLEFNTSNYPNPFNPTTNISFSIPQRGNVKLVVYDILGKEVTTLANRVYEAGKYEVTFDANNLPSGVYFYNLTTAQGTISKKMLLVK